MFEALGVARAWSRVGVAVAWTWLLLCGISAAHAAQPPKNPAPSVTLTAPTNGQSFDALATIGLAATASDSNGTVTRVNFYQGNTLIGTSATPPYTATWSNVAAGSYTLTAKAIDNQGAVGTSAPVSISVNSATALVITSPANGAGINVSSDLTVTGTFEGPSGSTILVDNQQSSVLATISGNTFTAVITAFSGTGGHSTGPTTITARLARPDRTTASRTISVTGYRNPLVVFTSPSCNTFDAPANVPLAVDAKAPGAAITRVEFRSGPTLLATITSPPYQFTWTNVLQDNYSITVTVYSTQGTVGTANMVVVVRGPNTPPSISITSPTEGAGFTAPANIPITVSATDPDGTVKQVEYFANGSPIGVTNVAPFGMTWSNVAAGSYALTARATDDRNGQTTSAPVNISVIPPNQPPAVSLTSPASGATFTAPATINLSADALDSDGSVAKVEFFQATTLIATVTTPPYTFAWSNVPAGSYTLSAKATDNLGAAATSPAVTVTVNEPPITITSPVNGTTVNDDLVLVTGRVNAPQYSGISVNGVVAFTDQNGNFYANNVALATGANTVTATLTRIDGTTATQSINLSSTGTAPIRIDADPLEGGVPLNVAFTVTTTGEATFTRADYDFNGDGTVDFTLNPPGGVVTASYPAPGVYLPIVTATDSLGRVVQHRFAVLADADPDVKLRATFNAMLDRLRAGDVDGAMAFITGGAAPQYRDLFNALKDAGQLTEAADTLGTLRGSTVGADLGELILSRETAEGTVAFPIWFLRGADGIWRIEGM